MRAFYWLNVAILCLTACMPSKTRLVVPSDYNLPAGEKTIRARPETATNLSNGVSSAKMLSAGQLLLMLDQEGVSDQCGPGEAIPIATTAGCRNICINGKWSEIC